MNAISLENITKLYKLYDNPINRLKEIVLKKPFHRPFTALDNITLEVRKGETLGVIGENGAGKSTLLKILAQTLYPSWGKLEINGLVSSLLELGSGFHPEFSGLDNIYFYGSLLGIEKKLLEKKKEEIIEFSGINDFITFPLKTYSSGMYVRLAFSVATAIDPDILVVDEALSVGDLHFQKKSTDRIMEFRNDGKTIVFCSHGMYFINRLCDRVIWLKNGKIHMEGEPLNVTQAYETYQLEKEMPARDTAEPEFTDSTEGKLVHFRHIHVHPYPLVNPGEDLVVEMETAVSGDTIPYMVAVVIKRIDELVIYSVGTRDREPLRGSRKFSIRFPDIQIKNGDFFIEAYLFDETLAHIYDVKSSDAFKIPKTQIEPGLVNLPYEWNI
jgi:ABC-type polysaccharide/polyol phosphate transport system ATPase subunit